MMRVIDQLLTADHVLVDVSLGHEHGADVAWLYDHAEVLSREDSETGVNLQVRLSPQDFAKLEKSCHADITVR